MLSGWSVQHVDLSCKESTLAYHHCHRTRFLSPRCPKGQQAPGMEREQSIWVGTSREKGQEDRQSPMKGKSRGPGSVCSLAEAAIMTWGGVLENEF